MSNKKPGSIAVPQGEFNISITSLNHAGEGVGRVEGRVVFVPGALPGEEALVRLEEMRSSYARARLVRLLSPAPERQPPACPSFGACGGCDLQHLSYPAQLAWKTRLVWETLHRVGGLENPPVRQILGMPHPWRYRNKVQLHPGLSAGRRRLGFYQEQSHRLAPLKECLLVPPEFLRLAAWLEERLEQVQAETLVLRRSAQGGLLVDLQDIRRQGSELEVATALRETFPEVRSVTATTVVRGRRHTKVLAGEEQLYEQLGSYRFGVSPTAFMQVNTPQAEVLYNLAAAAAGQGESLLELYSGVGVLTLFLAERFRTVLGVEVSPEAVADARANAALNGAANLKFVAGRAEKVLPELALAGYKAEVVVLDPPRAGAAPPVLDALLDLSPARVIYISCHPATLARDVRRLAAAGYSVQEVQPVDMFPQTAHVESIVLMTNCGLKGK